MEMNRRNFLVGTGAATTIMMSGCQSALFSLMYMIKGNDKPAEYDGLKNKKVAIVCRRPTDIQYNYGDIDFDMASRVGMMLKSYYKKEINLVGPSVVRTWADQNTWYEFVEVGSAVHAEVVLGIDLESVSMSEGPTLHRGTFDMTVTVTDCKTEEVLFRRPFSRLQYPRDRGLPKTEKTDRDFYEGCVTQMSKKIAELFYPSDRYQDFSPDSADM